MSANQPTRRAFCAGACRGGALLAMGALAGCGGSSPTSPSSNASPLGSVAGTVSGRTVSITIAAGSALAATGSLATVQVSLGTFLIARSGATSFSVLTATCTHEGCAISGFSGGNFVCPCHGSTFTASGSVVTGPANRSLQQFSAQFANDVLTFTA